jgi:hypothetical protein
MADSPRSSTHVPKALRVIWLNVSNQQPRPLSPKRAKTALIKHPFMNTSLHGNTDKLVRHESEAAVRVLENPRNSQPMK